MTPTTGAIAICHSATLPQWHLLSRLQKTSRGNTSMLHSYIQKTRWAIFLSLLGPLQACESSDDEFNREMIATTPQAIRYGTPDTDDSYRSVMGIAIKTREKASIYCSAVLIDAHKLLTAAHCVSTRDTFPFDDLRQKDAIQIVAQYGFQSSSNPPKTEFYPIGDVQIHPGYNPKTRIHDIAIVEIDANIDTTPFIPYPIATDPNVISLATQNKSPITYVGYGNDESSTYGSRKYCKSTAESHCPMSAVACSKSTSKASYDIPGGTVFDAIDDCAPCFGDSGGPALIDIDGVAHVFAITSFGDETCEDFTASTLAHEHRIWLNDRINPESHARCAAMPRHTRSNASFPILIAVSCIVAFARRRHHPNRAKTALFQLVHCVDSAPRSRAFSRLS